LRGHMKKSTKRRSKAGGKKAVGKSRAKATMGDGLKPPAIELGTLHEGLQPGRWLITSGDRTDIPSTAVSAGELILQEQVQQSLDPRVYGNVDRATQGETHREVLGSGDASHASQQFTLRHPYLTSVPARNAAGMSSTLEVFVDGIPWQEVESLGGTGPQDHVFGTRASDDGRTTVMFGDGYNGARVPSGSKNVVAVYRTRTG
jgi:hypothetical protein